MQSCINHVVGADNFIQFERNRSLTFCYEILHVFESVDKTEYFHIYKITYIEPFFFEMEVHDTLGVRDGLVCYSIRTGNFDVMPAELLKRSTPKI